MKVNDPNLSNLGPAGVGGTHAPESVRTREKTADASTSGGRDHVSLSDLSAKLRALDSESPERAAYLEKLSAAVQSGKYQVDAREVSRKIIGDALKAPE